MTSEITDTFSSDDYEFITEGSDESTEIPDISVEHDTSEFVEEVPETPRAKKYRKAVTRGLGHLWRPLIQSPDTIQDGAAILLYGPDIAKEAGRFADQNATARKVIDFVTDNTESGAIALFAAVSALSLQLLRNHEQALQPSIRGFRIPGTKRFIQFKLGLRLGKLQNLSYDPAYLTNRVFSQPELVAKLEKQGMRIAWQSNNNPTQANANGRARRWRRSGENPSS